MIYLACDHAGYELMQKIIEHLKILNLPFENVGALTYEKTDNYVIYTIKANKKVMLNPDNRGIYICGTGIGTSICANRNKKIRAALCHSVEFAKLSRLHNNANVLVLPGRFMDEKTAFEIVDTFLNTQFEGGRHAERVAMLEGDDF